MFTVFYEFNNNIYHFFDDYKINKFTYCTEKQSIKQFRIENNLVGKHIKFIKL